jgi:hypothetical protein
MKTCLEIVSEACRTFGSPPPKSLEDINDETGRRLLAALNRTAEDLSLECCWLSQIRVQTFTLDGASYYNPIAEGYDLDLMTKDTFDRFSAAFLWDLTNNRKVKGTTVENFLQKQHGTPSLPSYLTYFRVGKYIKFYPADTRGVEVQFYYQTKNLCYEQAVPNTVESDIISNDKQIPFHNAKLLLRGILLNYARNNGLDTEQFQDTYETYKDKCISAEAPQSTISMLEGYTPTLGRFPFVIGY